MDQDELMTRQDPFLCSARTIPPLLSRWSCLACCCGVSAPWVLGGGGIHGLCQGALECPGTGGGFESSVREQVEIER